MNNTWVVRKGYHVKMIKNMFLVDRNEAFHVLLLGIIALRV